MIKNNSIAVYILSGLMLAALSACTPPEIQYCSKFGVSGTPEYAKCVGYYQQQDALFTADARFCSAQADVTYPPTLYDYGHFEPTMGGGFSYGGRYIGPPPVIDVPPDYRHNAELDALRMRIIAPCMDARGWNSPTDWQAGRHAVTAAKPTAKLPWQ